MSKRWQYAINGLLLGFIAALAYDAAGQTLQPVDTGGGFSLSIVLVLGVVIVLIAGLIIWHKRNPSGMAKAQAEAAAVRGELGAVAHKLADSLRQHIGTHAALVDTLPAALAATPPAATSMIDDLSEQKRISEIDTDKLAAVEAARVAYENAKADAGIP